MTVPPDLPPPDPSTRFGYTPPSSPAAPPPPPPAAPAAPAPANAAVPPAFPTGPVAEMPTARRKVWPLVVLGCIVGFVLLMGALFVADQYVQSREYEAFMTATEQAEDTMEVALADWDKAAQAYPQWETNEADFTALWGRLGAIAQTASSDLAANQATLEGLSFLPWHTALQRARDDYLDHTDAWQDDYENTVKKGNNPDYKFDDGTDITRTFALARQSSLDAIPMLFVSDFYERQAAEFAN